MTNPLLRAANTRQKVSFSLPTNLVRCLWLLSAVVLLRYSGRCDCVTQQIRTRRGERHVVETPRLPQRRDARPETSRKRSNTDRCQNVSQGAGRTAAPSTERKLGNSPAVLCPLLVERYRFSSWDPRTSVHIRVLLTKEKLHDTCPCERLNFKEALVVTNEPLLQMSRRRNTSVTTCALFAAHTLLLWKHGLR